MIFVIKNIASRIFSFTQVLFLAIFIFSFMMPAFVGAQQGATGEWIDRATIIYQGSLYKDSNPFDSTYEYVAYGSSQGDQCGKIKPQGDFSTAEIVQKTINSAGNCPSDSASTRANISLANKERSVITAYKKKWNNSQGIERTAVYLPVYGERKNTVSQGIDPKWNGFFKQFPPDLSGYEDGNILIFTGNEWGQTGAQFEENINEKRTGQWVDLRDNMLKVKLCAGADAVRWCRPTWTTSLTFAPEDTPDPRAEYPAFGGGEVDGNSDIGNDTSENTGCESKGGPFGWILCGILGGALKALDTFAGFVQDRLDISLQDEDMIRSAWGEIRTIANILFVAAFLFIIISQVVVGRF